MNLYKYSYFKKKPVINGLSLISNNKNKRFINSKKPYPLMIKPNEFYRTALQYKSRLNALALNTQVYGIHMLRDLIKNHSNLVRITDREERAIRTYMKWVGVVTNIAMKNEDDLFENLERTVFEEQTNDLVNLEERLSRLKFKTIKFEPAPLRATIRRKLIRYWPHKSSRRYLLKYLFPNNYPRTPQSNVSKAFKTHKVNLSRSIRDMRSCLEESLKIMSIECSLKPNDANYMDSYKTLLTLDTFPFSVLSYDPELFCLTNPALIEKARNHVLKLNSHVNSDDPFNYLISLTKE